MPSPAVELDHVIEAVRYSFPLANLALPDEFFPAHLSVAIIDAVLDSRGKNSENAVPASERYCRWAGIARTRADRWDEPLPEAQESLTDMIGRFDELGDRQAAEEAFGTKQLLPDASNARMESVPRAARALRRAGIEVLQDVQARQSEEVERILRDCAAFGEAAARLFLMYAGSDDLRTWRRLRAPVRGGRSRPDRDLRGKGQAPGSQLRVRAGSLSALPGRPDLASSFGLVIGRVEARRKASSHGRCRRRRIAVRRSREFVDLPPGHVSG